jgi:hypothetical protein
VDAEVGEPTAEGAVFARWISPALAAEDLLRSRLSVFEN